MSIRDELYVRDLSSDNMLAVSDPENEVWDDSTISEAYDKAMNKANAEIAKQIAMETNSKFKEHVKCIVKKGKGPSAKTPKTKWEKGMPCRAVYTDDRLEYEAEITAIVDKDECVVRFLGYENSEIVSVRDLMESQGEEARVRQIEDATGEKFDDGFESLSNDGDLSMARERRGMPPNQGKGKKSKKKSQVNKGHDTPKLPDLLRMNSPFSGRSVIGDVNMQSMPIPPPPLPPCLRTNNPEDQALASMLISWYMTGYQTGLYQGMKRAKK